MIEQANKKKRRIPLLFWILLGAFAIRMCYLAELSTTPWSSHPIIDERYLDEWAIKISHGVFISEEAFFRGPLYAFLLGGIYAIFGHGYLVPRFLTMVFGTVSCFLVYYLGKEAFGPLPSLIAGTIAAFYFPFIFFEGTLLIVGTFIFLTLLLLFLLFQLVETITVTNDGEQPPIGRNKALIRWGAAGIIAGLAAITRPNILLFLGLFTLWMFSKVRRSKSAGGIPFHYLICFLGALALVITPVTIHNYAVSRDFVLISSQAGINFFIGNNPESTGKYTPLPGYYPLRGHYVDTAWLFARKQAEKEAGFKLQPSQVSQIWFQKGLRFWREQPLAAVLVFLKKFHIFWLGPEINNIMYVSYRRSLSRILKIAVFHFGIIGPLSLFGLLTLLWNKRKSPISSNQLIKRRILFLFVISYTFSVVPFFNAGRYRLPVVPVLIIFAAWAGLEICRKIREKQWKPLSLFCLPLLAGLFLAVNIDPYGVTGDDPAKARWSQANAYQARGQTEAAMDLYQKALEFNPGLSSAHLNLGNCYLARNEYQEAVAHYQQAAEGEPGNATVYNNTAIAYLGLKDYETALAFVSEAWKRDSLNPFVHDTYGNYYLETGDYDRAIKAFNEAIRLWPGYRDAWSDLAKAYTATGLTVEADACHRKIEELNTKN